jgi:hypothetical protein
MAAAGQRLALIVASTRFTDATLQKLDAPGEDAALLARVLEAPDIGGFDDVKQLVDRPSHEVRREIEAFFAKRKRDDLVLLYFSGHGIKDDDGQLYLATVDTQRGLYRSTAVPAGFVNETMGASRSRRQVLILDCCHSGAFARGMVAKGGESVDIRDRFEGRGRVVLTASTSTQYAFQGDQIIGEGGGSVFTHYLVQGMETGEADRDGDGWISLDELYEYVYEAVSDETPQQTPGKWTFDVQGRILIARSPLGERELPEEESRLAAQYAEATRAVVAGQWKEALRRFERLEAERPGYRDVAEQVARMRDVVTRLEDADAPHPPHRRPRRLPEEVPSSVTAAPQDERSRLTQLRTLLVERFNLEELRTLCFDLGVEYENLPGEGKSAKARELVAHLARRGRTQELVRLIVELRPDVRPEDVGASSATRRGPRPHRLPEG